MTTDKEALDYFGEFLMKNHRDKALLTLKSAFQGKWKNENLKNFQNLLVNLSSEQQNELFQGFEYIISGALHDLLFSLQEENHFTNRIKILVDGFDVVEVSDGIHGEQFSTKGWIERFSNYKESLLNENK